MKKNVRQVGYLQRLYRYARSTEHKIKHTFGGKYNSSPAANHVLTSTASTKTL